MTESGRFEDTHTGTPQGGIKQYVTERSATRRSTGDPSPPRRHPGERPSRPPLHLPRVGREPAPGPDLRDPRHRRRGRSRAPAAGRRARPAPRGFYQQRFDDQRRELWLEHVRADGDVLRGALARVPRPRRPDMPVATYAKLARAAQRRRRPDARGRHDLRHHRRPHPPPARCCAG